MDCIKIVSITGLIVGFTTWFLTKISIEYEIGKKWTLGAFHDTDPDIGWHPMLERQLDNHHWEYIYINKDNLPVIEYFAHSNIPLMSSQLVSSKGYPIYKMVQDMVNRGHGKITSIEKKKNPN